MFYSIKTICKQINKLYDKNCTEDMVIKNIGRFIPKDINKDDLIDPLSIKIRYKIKHQVEKERIEELVERWKACNYDYNSLAKQYKVFKLTIQRNVRIAVLKHYPEMEYML